MSYFNSSRQTNTGSLPEGGKGACWISLPKLKEAAWQSWFKPRSAHLTLTIQPTLILTMATQTHKEGTQEPDYFILSTMMVLNF